MDSKPNNKESDIKSWLKCALVKENLTDDFSVKIVGNSKKGEGYIGDIVFVNVSANTKHHSPKTYKLVLKCSKQSQALRDTVPIKDTFENEMYVYDVIFPAFAQFQLNKGVEKIFDSVPNCYGTFSSENMEVIVLENLKEMGYSLYNSEKPLTLDHIKLVLTEYGKWHGIAAAMQDQQPEKFKEIVSKIKNMWPKFAETMDVNKFFGSPIEEVMDLLRNDLDEYAINKLENFKQEVSYISTELVQNTNYFSIVSHGDCWSNNFMFKYEEGNPDKPLKVSMLDWQVVKFCSPVTDLSYFIYACIAKEDLNNFDDILMFYYQSFSSYVKRLGSDPERLFPYSQLLRDWKIFGKFGIMMAILAIKIAVCDKDEVADFVEIAESGRDMSETFMFEIKNKNALKNRLLCIIEHILERDFI